MDGPSKVARKLSQHWIACQLFSQRGLQTEALGFPGAGLCLRAPWALVNMETPACFSKVLLL
jgi:hypothetical protein